MIALALSWKRQRATYFPGKEIMYHFFVVGENRQRTVIYDRSPQSSGVKMRVLCATFCFDWARP